MFLVVSRSTLITNEVLIYHFLYFFKGGSNLKFLRTGGFDGLDHPRSFSLPSVFWAKVHLDPLSPQTDSRQLVIP